MKKMMRNLMASAFAGVLVLFPVVCALGMSPALTASAHGHGSGHHSSSSPTYYYCGGHGAHYHNNGVCPYDVPPAPQETPVDYYCGGHDAHCHDNGICPYDVAVTPQETPADYYYCGGHDAHCHDNGVCPYAGETASQVNPTVNYYYCNGHEAHCHDNGVCPYDVTSGTAGAVHSCGWVKDGGGCYWYEDVVKQGTYNDAKGVIGDGIVRGREIYDPDSDGWYWLDAYYDGAKACNKEVWVPYIYQQEKSWGEKEITNNSDASGTMSSQIAKAIHEGTGKWVRYDADGKMYKGWYTVSGSDIELYPSQAGNTYYYDPVTGLMAKGYVTIEGVTYHFNEITGVKD